MTVTIRKCCWYELFILIIIMHTNAYNYYTNKEFYILILKISMKNLITNCNEFRKTFRLS